MNKFPSYQETNTPWIGEIPTGWSLKSLKHIFTEKKSTKNSDLGCGSISFGKVIYKDDEKIPESTKEAYQEVLDGEFLINPLNLNYDLKSLRIGLSRINVVVSQGYIVLNIKDGFDPKYYEYLLRKFDVEHMKSLGQGVRQTISFTHLKDEKLVVPPVEEQDRISRYLDKKTSQIDSLINKIEKKIELLKEQRTTLINQCVTKGLDQNVEMKESGVEWIGEIPKHWETTKLKLHGEVLIGLSFDKDDIVDDGNGTLVLRSSNVQNGKVSFTDNIWVKTEVPDKLFVRNGDILICSRNGSRDLIGKNCILRDECAGMTWGVFMSVFRTDTPNFFYWVLNSQVFKSQSGLYLTSTINQLTVTTLENLTFPYVSDINEQQAIHEYLSKRVAGIDEIIQLEERRISTLKEYRQSLISSVVTGMLRVTEYMV